MKKEKLIHYITSKEMRTLETNAEYFGISLLQLMENAGHHVATEVSSRFQKGESVAIFCGLGGNGGDGFVAARHLANSGFKVAIILSGRGKDISHEAALKNFLAVKSMRERISVLEVTDSSLIRYIDDAGIIIDGLLGTGTKGRLKPPILQLAEQINSLSGFKIAIDIPTGIDSDSGEVLGNAVRADVTVTFHGLKPGLELAKKFAGEVVLKDIGLPKEFENYAGPGDVLAVAKERPKSSHKGDFGRLLVIGGNEVFSGAPTLVSLAALRTGSDIVYVAAPTKTAQAISSISPDLITVKLDGNHLHPSNIEHLKSYIQMADAIVLGPGLGLHPETQEFVRTCISTIELSGKPMVLDADGLKAFAEFKRQLKIPVVLTPHKGEYAILTGQALPDHFNQQIVDLQKTATELNAVLLLKGQTDIICNKDRFKLNFTGNPGMTVGGTGDVLSGIVGSFLAQKVTAFEAAVAGAFTNGAAGDFVANELGHHMLASDLLPWIPHVLDDPMSHVRVRRDSGAVA